jgi:benzoylformate decarboxylase
LLSGYDVLFAVGINLLRQYLYHEPARPLPAAARLVQLDDHAWEIGKNYAVEVGLLGDPKTGLAELDTRLAETMSAAQVAAAGQRCERLAARRADERARLEADLLRQRDRRPMTAATLMSALGRVLPPRAAVVQEAPTTHQFLLERLGAIKDPSWLFRASRLGAGLGHRLCPGRPTGLARPARDRFAGRRRRHVWDPRSVDRRPLPNPRRLGRGQQRPIQNPEDLRRCAETAAPRHNGSTSAWTWVQPEIDFVGLARSFGLEADRISDPDTLSDRLKAWLASPRPLLLDVPIERD